MDWISKFVSSLKIPLRILLPSVWLFSCLVLFLPPNFILKLHLDQIKEEFATVLGLVFIISSCLILVYVIYYLKEKISNLYFKVTLKYKTLQMMKHFSDAEYQLMLSLYKSPDFSGVIDYADPITKAMIGRKFIYIGNNVPATVSWNNEIWIKGVLQPFVRETIEREYKKTKRKVATIEKKRARTSDADKIEKFNQILDKLYKNEECLRR